MGTTLVRYWHAVAVRGALALALALVVVVWPYESLSVVALGFGVYAMADGLVTLWIALGARRHGAALGLRGLVAGAAGLVLVLGLGLAHGQVVKVAGVAAIGAGVVEIWLARRIRAEIVGSTYWILAGAVSVVFGVMLLVTPPFATPALIVVMGGYGLAFGIAMVAWGVRLRTLRRAVGPKEPAGAVP
jgi:uncharacterized membrane protein HdeD (DUF308 family)